MPPSHGGRHIPALVRTIPSQGGAGVRRRSPQHRRQHLVVFGPRARGQDAADGSPTEQEGGAEANV